MDSTPRTWTSVVELGAIVKDERRRQGLRQEDLAFAAGVSRPIVIDVEAGRPTIRMDSALKVIHALGLVPAVTPAGRKPGGTA